MSRTEAEYAAYTMGAINMAKSLMFAVEQVTPPSLLTGEQHVEYVKSMCQVAIDNAIETEAERRGEE